MPIPANLLANNPDAAAAADTPFVKALRAAVFTSDTASAPRAAPVLREALLTCGAAYDLRHWAAASAGLTCRPADALGSAQQAEHRAALRLYARPPPPPWPQPLRHRQSPARSSSAAARSWLEGQMWRSSDNRPAALWRAWEAARADNVSRAPRLFICAPPPHATSPLQHVSDAASFVSQLAVLPKGGKRAQARAAQDAFAWLQQSIQHHKTRSEMSSGVHQSAASQLGIAQQKYRHANPPLPPHLAQSLLSLAQTEAEVLAILQQARRQRSAQVQGSAPALEHLVKVTLPWHARCAGVSRLALLGRHRAALALAVGDADKADAALGHCKSWHERSASRLSEAGADRVRCRLSHLIADLCARRRAWHRELNALTLNVVTSL
jgi:hypothetical protein